MYANIDLAIAPLQFNNFNDSKSEIKVAECGRYGIPLIATDCGCYDETIKNGETGYLISPDNPRSEWVSRMIKVVKDKKHREEMGQNLKRITDEHFNINKNVQGRIDLYHEIMKAKTAAQEKTNEEQPAV
jgi:glycosyltransferase involved in cell wall biosynthesis